MNVPTLAEFQREIAGPIDDCGLGPNYHTIKTLDGNYHYRPGELLHTHWDWHKNQLIVETLDVKLVEVS